MDTTDLDLEAITAGVHASVPILGQMGVRVVDARRGRAAATLPVGPNSNHIGTSYAGSLFSVAEMLGGVIGFNTFQLEGFFPIVKSVDIHYRRPAFTDVTATTELDDTEIARIEGEAEANGKSEFVLEATLTDATGEVVATTTGVYQVRRI